MLQSTLLEGGSGTTELALTMHLDRAAGACTTPVKRRICGTSHESRGLSQELFNMLRLLQSERKSVSCRHSTTVRHFPYLRAFSLQVDPFHTYVQLPVMAPASNPDQSVKWSTLCQETSTRLSTFGIHSHGWSSILS